MNLDEPEACAFLGSLFPGGLKDPFLIAEICPEGWVNSPLFACYHPPPETCYAESLEFSKNLKNLGLLRMRRKGEVAQTPPEDPEPTFEEFMVKHKAESGEISAVHSIDEPAELLGLCLWDVFSDNHEVIAADGRVVDLGSFRGSAGVIADFFEGARGGKEGTEDDIWSTWDDGDYLRFYMGTWWLARRADLSPVYQLIFRRLKSLGADWHYSFPRVYVVHFDHPKDTPPEDYDPSAALAAENERRKDEAELRKISRRLAEGLVEDKRRALDLAPPATVQAYQEVYGRDPHGWPPDPDSPD